jgi:hypothetical protein
MFSLDNLNLGDFSDRRTKVVVEFINDLVYHPVAIRAVLERAQLKQATNSSYNQSRFVWLEVVPYAAQRGRLDVLADAVADIMQDSQFKRALERKLTEGRDPTTTGGHPWYRCENPWKSGFMGPGARRAVIDREGLRAGLRSLTTEDYRVLVICGAVGSGKSHSWQLIDHLHSAGQLVGYRFARVKTDSWSDVVTGEELALSLADTLGLRIGLTPSGELSEATIRKILNMIAGQFPQNQATPCWIVLDGLDQPMVHQSARDMARRLITMVAEGDIKPARLIITGLDVTGQPERRHVQMDQIPDITEVLVRQVLTDVAKDLGREADPAELDRHVAAVLGPPDNPRTLDKVEEAVVSLVKSEWAGAHDDV